MNQTMPPSLNMLDFELKILEQEKLSLVPLPLPIVDHCEELESDHEEEHEPGFSGGRETVPPRQASEGDLRINSFEQQAGGGAVWARVDVQQHETEASGDFDEHGIDSLEDAQHAHAQQQHDPPDVDQQYEY